MKNLVNLGDLTTSEDVTKVHKISMNMDQCNAIDAEKKVFILKNRLLDQLKFDLDGYFNTTILPTTIPSPSQLSKG